MFTVVLGLPGLFTDFCRDLCREIVSSTGRTVTMIEVDPSVVASPTRQSERSLASLARAALRINEEHAIVVLRQPDFDFGQSLIEGQTTCIVALDDPRAVVLSEAGGLEHAVRQVGASCACIYPLLSNANAKILRPSDFGDRPDTVATTLIAACGIAVDANLQRTVSDRVRSFSLQGRQLATFDDVADLIASRLNQQQALMVEAALLGYVSAFRGEPFTKLIVSRDLFYIADRPQTPATSKIDVTGRARCLVHGPYIYIPPGTWKIELTLAFSGDLLMAPFVVDVTRIRDQLITELGRTSVSASPGRNVVKLIVSTFEPDAPCEFRLWSERPLFEGTVMIGYAEITCLDETSLVDIAGSVELLESSLTR